VLITKILFHDRILAHNHIDPDMHLTRYPYTVSSRAHPLPK